MSENVAFAKAVVVGTLDWQLSKFKNGVPIVGDLDQVGRNAFTGTMIRVHVAVGDDRDALHR